MTQLKPTTLFLNPSLNLSLNQPFQGREEPTAPPLLLKLKFNFQDVKERSRCLFTISHSDQALPGANDDIHF